jgi:endonuclease/exonuclease/phosphatase family metal-dependent hydrolase
LLPNKLINRTCQRQAVYQQRWKGLKMKILTYNFYYGGKRDDGKQWSKLLDDFNPDFILAQETFDPCCDSYAEHFIQKGKGNSIIWRPVPAKWGSAVVATRHELTEIPINGFEGWVVGARVADFRIGDEAPRPLMVFSIHTPSPGPYEQKVHEILDRIMEISRGSEILIGGDFNITTAFRHPTEEEKNTEGELTILRRLRTELGLTNALQAAQPNKKLPQTLRWSGNKNIPYHCDGIFVPHSWLRHLKSCDVITEGWSDKSDHFPILAELTAQPGCGIGSCE